MKVAHSNFLSRASFFSQERKLQNLSQKWNISGPNFSYAGLIFDLDYESSDFILDQMVIYSIWDKDCKNGDSVAGDILTANLTLDTETAGDGYFMRDIQLEIGLNPDNIANSSIYSEQIQNGTLTASIDFCVRFSLQTKSDTPFEVNFRETLVTLIVDLTNGFSIGDVAVESKERITQTANQAYGIEAAQCNTLNEPLTPLQQSATRNQGAVMRICVQPDSITRASGVYMRRIDSFLFERDYGGGQVIMQVAVLNGGPAVNGLTNLYCGEGWETCALETILFSNFFRSAGTVEGSGTAAMQFGGSVGPTRHLRSTDVFSEKDDEDIAVVAEFRLDINLKRDTRSGAVVCGTIWRIALTVAAATVLLL
jgi:hypothetical protein